MMSVSPLSDRHVRPEIIVTLCFLPPWRLTVTACMQYLVPIDKQILLSNFGSYTMASLCWLLFFYILFVPTLFNLFISLCSVGFLILSRSMSLDMDKYESESLIEIFLIGKMRYLDALVLILFILLSSRHKPYCLAMINSIFFFLRAFRLIFYFFSVFW